MRSKADQDLDLDIIEASRNDRWEAEKRILRHLGTSSWDRYSGEFNNEDGLAQIFAFKSKALRDGFAAPFAALPKRHPNIQVTTKDDEAATTGAYGFDAKITVRGAKSLAHAHISLASAFQFAAAGFPGREGAPWAVFVDDYETASKMRFKGAADGQIRKMTALVDLLQNAEMAVISTHTSKSIQLPVAQIEFPRNYTTVTFRDNFHDICVSVDSKFPIKDDRNFSNLFETSKPDGYFEGFPKKLVHGSYDSNQSQFSCAVYGYGSLMTLLSTIETQDARHDPFPKAEQDLSL